MTRRVVLFDVDGVLLDSVALHRDVWNQWALSRSLDVEAVWRATHGRRPLDTVADVAAHLDAAAEYETLQRLLFDSTIGVTAYDGAVDLLESLKPGSWAIVTSGQRSIVASRFATVGLPLPAVVVDSEDVTAGKPAPDGYLLAAARLGVAAAACLVVEDAPAGIAAGAAAGMRVLAVTTTHPAADLTTADEIAPSLREAAPAVTRWLEDR